MDEHQGQQELFPQPAPEPVAIEEIAARIGAVADAKEHGPVPTDTDERSASMAGLRDNENLRTQQAPVLPPGALKALSGPGGKIWDATRKKLNELPPGPKF